ncbi:MAG TPA: VWA domain-containing protein [Rhodobacteraceae bacterium]|nr:VWA domain-containing protein [Paracoccaceae bacterium]|tara:strand:- start:2781 stop:3962 length:1182 start_codon:yes stop_codon:yes gene_type:complete
MFLPFFDNLRAHKIPVSLREFLSFLEAMKAGLATYEMDHFYLLGRTILVKDERNLDKFDRAFAATFKGLEDVSPQDMLEQVDLPDDWLRKLAEKTLSDADKDEIDGLGGFDKLMETLRKRLEEQKSRHQGGSKWLGTAGTSPFGAYGYNPEGIRMGQDKSRHQRAVKVWDKRHFKNLDGDVELGTRNIKVALKRLRKWAREGAQDELDLESTIQKTAENGYLNVQTRPERRNAVKVLLLLDVGGSMDSHIKLVEELFSAARSEFKHLESYYFHNCLYEGLWRDNERRWTEQVPTEEILRTYGPDYKCIFVGDASMSPYEIAYVGGANEHWNKISGQQWLLRAQERWNDSIWLNPVPEKYWPYTQSIAMVQKIFENRMVPMTLDGISSGMKLIT